MYYRRMDGVGLYLLGRRLMKLGEQAVPPSASTRMPVSTRSVLVDVLTHPGTSVGEVAGRTGFPQSLVSAAISYLRANGALVTAPDPVDRRRTLASGAPDLPARVAQVGTGTIDSVLASATTDPEAAHALLDRLATLLRDPDPT